MNTVKFSVGINLTKRLLTNSEEENMLILTRRIGEKIMINENISFQIMEIKGNQVRMGIEAPADVSIHREEIFLKVKAEQERLMHEDIGLDISLTEAFHSQKKSVKHRYLTH